MHWFLFTNKQSSKQSLAVPIFDNRRVMFELMLEPAYTYCDGAFLYNPAVNLSSKKAYKVRKYTCVSASGANSINNKIKYNF